MARRSEGQVVRPTWGGRAAPEQGGEVEQGAGEEDHGEDGGGGDPDGEQVWLNIFYKWAKTFSSCWGAGSPASTPPRPGRRSKMRSCSVR